MWNFLKKAGKALCASVGVLASLISGAISIIASPIVGLISGGVFGWRITEGQSLRTRLATVLLASVHHAIVAPFVALFAVTPYLVYTGAKAGYESGLKAALMNPLTQANEGFQELKMVGLSDSERMQRRAQAASTSNNVTPISSPRGGSTGTVMQITGRENTAHHTEATARGSNNHSYNLYRQLPQQVVANASSANSPLRLARKQP